jgi:hypothetical protein
MPETLPSSEGQAPVESPAGAQQARKIDLTPELIRKITARVYAMLLADTRIEGERARLSNQKTPGTNGGRHAV